MNVRNRRGQVIIMVTLVLIVMGGMLGLAVDLGWSFYVKKTAQAATDAAALATVSKAYSYFGQGGPYTCGGVLTCAADPISCTSATGNLVNGCQYAQRNDFQVGGHDQHQNVLISADVPGTPGACLSPTGPAPVDGTVCVYYWATVRGYEGIPQLFSSILGNSYGASSARSTAAIVDTAVPGSLYTLNWETDPGYHPKGHPGARFEDGVGLTVVGDGTIDADGGIFIASSANGEGGTYATESNGAEQGGVIGSSIQIYGDGAAEDPGDYTPTPTNSNKLREFLDPMRGKGQPAAPSMGAPRPVPNGEIMGDCDNPSVMPPGSYWAYDPNTGAPTGAPIQIRGCVTFSAGSSGTWGDYVFYGGMHFNGSGGGTVVTVGPGRYFVVGARGSDPIFSVPNNVILQDMSPPSEAPTNQGEIFVFTDHRYPGLEIPGELSGVLNEFTYGWVDIQTGNNDNSAINLHGLNRTFSLPDNLANFSPTVLWWDQGNAQIDYNPDGSINWDDNGNAVLNPDTSIDPFLSLQAGPNTDLYGVLYMPRGSYLDFQGSPEMNSPLMLIAGSITITGGGEINLPRPSMPLLRKVVALIE